jgi:hypothetical protein
MPAGFCWQCGNKLVDAMRRPVAGVVRFVDGHEVRLHRICSRTFDEDQRRLTAQPSDTPPRLPA